MRTVRLPRVATGLERYQELLATLEPGPNAYLLLLGLETLDLPQLLGSVERGLPYQTFESLLSNTALASDDVLALIDVPARTLTRRKQEGRFRPSESDRLVRASRIFAGALSLFNGDRDEARQWLAEPKQALGGTAPLAMARTEVGALEVERLMGRLEHGVFS